MGFPDRDTNKALMLQNDGNLKHHQGARRGRVSRGRVSRGRVSRRVSRGRVSRGRVSRGRVSKGRVERGAGAPPLGEGGEGGRGAARAAEGREGRALPPAARRRGQRGRGQWGEEQGRPTGWDGGHGRCTGRMRELPPVPAGIARQEGGTGKWG